MKYGVAPMPAWHATIMISPIIQSNYGASVHHFAHLAAE